MWIVSWVVSLCFVYKQSYWNFLIQLMKILFSQILTVAVIKEPGSILDCPGRALAAKIAERRRKRKIVAIIYVCVWLA